MNHYWLLFIGCLAFGYVCAGRGDSLTTTIMKSFALGWLGGFVAVAGIALFFAGCTPTVEHQVTAPQLDTLGATIKKIVIKDCQKPVLAMPPVPQDCTLDIRPDSAVGSTRECEDLLRFYVRARLLLKPVALSNASRPAD